MVRADRSSLIAASWASRSETSAFGDLPMPVVQMACSRSGEMRSASAYWGQNKSSAKSYAKVERNMNCLGSRMCGLRSLWIGTVRL